MRVLAAGIGGASLGTEIIKSLVLAGGYEIFGCDISPHAYGHYAPGPAETFLVGRDNYIDEIHAICMKKKIRAIVPGGEEPSILLAAALDRFAADNIAIASNTAEVVAVCSDKGRLFNLLRDNGVPIPFSVSADRLDRLDEVACPCIIKPATGSGGSSFVFLASDRAEAGLYVRYLLDQGQTPIVQEYVPADEGEFTVGVLSLPDGSLVGSIALKRMFHAKLSVMAKTRTGLISSGYSQGLIDDFPEIRRQAEKIAALLDSRGPLNIQGRVKNGVFLPFEINPRFSASTHLRSLAGFNEIDIYLQNIAGKRPPREITVTPGLYLRSLAEVAVRKTDLIT